MLARSAIPHLASPSSTREAVIAAAAELFAAAGFAATRISDIATSAGVGKGTVYEHFASKEDLLLATCLALCRHRLELLRERISCIATTLGGAERSTAGALHEVVHLLLQRLPGDCSHHARLFVDLWTVSVDRPSFLTRVRADLQLAYDEWERLLERVAAGVTRPTAPLAIDPALLLKLCSALIDGLVWQRTFRPDNDGEGVARVGADLLVAALRPRNAP